MSNHWSRAIVRVDPAPGFVSMSNNDSLKHFNITIEVGRTRIPSPRRLYVNLKKSSFVKNLEEDQSVNLASLSSLHVLTSASGFPGYRLTNCGPSGTSSPTNSCPSPILNLSSPNMNCVPPTIVHSPSARSPRTPVDLSHIHPQSKLEILSTSSQTRTSHELVTATSSSPPTLPGAS